MEESYIAQSQDIARIVQNYVPKYLFLEVPQEAIPKHHTFCLKKARGRKIMMNNERGNSDIDVSQQFQNV